MFGAKKQVCFSVFEKVFERMVKLDGVVLNRVRTDGEDGITWIFVI